MVLIFFAFHDMIMDVILKRKAKTMDDLNENQTPETPSEPPSDTETEYDDAFVEDEDEARRGKKIRTWFLILFAILLMLVGVAVAVILPLYQSYRDSYVNIDIVTRDEEYSRPDYPTDIEIPENSDELDWGDDEDDFPEDTETLPSNPDETIDGTTANGIVTAPPETTTPETEKAPSVVDNGIYYVKQKDPNVVNILILGVDTRDISKFSGRTDSMIVCSYNKKTGEVKLISLLRDLLVPIEGHDWNRLNTAYAFGGISLCINTINDLFGLDIQKFVMINFSGTKTFINSCGGVDLSLSSSELKYLNNKNVTKNADGTYHLDGDAALTHMRNRAVGNDFGRTTRQRQVMMALYRQVVNSRDLTQIYSLIREGFKLVRTNMKLSEILDLATSVVGFGTDLQMTSAYVPKKGTYWAAKYKKKSVIGFDIDKNVAYLEKLIYG